MPKAAGPVAGQSYRGEQMGELPLTVARQFPDIHRELHRLNVLVDTDGHPAVPGR